MLIPTLINLKQSDRHEIRAILTVQVNIGPVTESPFANRLLWSAIVRCDFGTRTSPEKMCRKRLGKTTLFYTL